MDEEEKELRMLIEQESCSEGLIDPEVGIYYFRSIGKKNIVNYIKSNRNNYIKIIKDIIQN